MSTHSLLATFDALVLRHRQSTPPLEQLRTTTDCTLQQLQAQEQPLVAAQIQAYPMFKPKLQPMRSF